MSLLRLRGVLCCGQGRGQWGSASPLSHLQAFLWAIPRGLRPYLVLEQMFLELMDSGLGVHC